MHFKSDWLQGYCCRRGTGGAEEIKPLAWYRLPLREGRKEGDEIYKLLHCELARHKQIHSESEGGKSSGLNLRPEAIPIMNVYNHGNASRRLCVPSGRLLTSTGCHFDWWHWGLARGNHGNGCVAHIPTHSDWLGFCLFSCGIMRVWAGRRRASLLASPVYKDKTSAWIYTKGVKCSNYTPIFNLCSVNVQPSVLYCKPVFFTKGLENSKCCCRSIISWGLSIISDRHQYSGIILFFLPIFSSSCNSELTHSHILSVCPLEEVMMQRCAE